MIAAVWHIALWCFHISVPGQRVHACPGQLWIHAVWQQKFGLRETLN